jgi:hypothetical protein
MLIMVTSPKPHPENQGPLGRKAVRAQDKGERFARLKLAHPLRKPRVERAGVSARPMRAKASIARDRLALVYSAARGLTGGKIKPCRNGILTETFDGV